MYICLLLFSLISAVFCNTYSIGFISTNITDVIVKAQVYVNGVGQLSPNFAINVQFNTILWANFVANVNDKIQVQISSTTQAYNNYYVINNGPGGSGTTVFDSRTNNFSPANLCLSGTCAVTVQGSSNLSNGNLMTFFVNGIQQVTNYTGQPSFTFNVAAGDSLFFNFENNTAQSIPFQVTYSYRSVPNPVITWYYNTYATYINIPNSALTSTFTLPASGTYTAGNNVQVQIYSSPTAQTFTTTLTCPNLSPIVTTVTSNTGNNYFVAVPSNYYGVNCNLAATSPSSISTPVTLTIAQAVQFSLPNPSNTYIVNDPIPVSLTANVIDPNSLVSITQVCTGIANVVYPNVAVGGQSFNANIPPNYSGSCTFSSSASGIYLAASPTVTVTIGKGTIVITSPSGNPRLGAGNYTQVAITATSTISSLTIQLDCGGSMQEPAAITPNSDPQDFLVPANFLGTSCSFSVINVPSYYNTPASVPVSVAQSVQFSSPLPGSGYFVNTGIPVSLSATTIDATQTVTVTQQCGSNTQTYPNVKIGTSFTASAPFDYTGSCTFSSSSNAIYNAAVSTVSIEMYVFPTLSITAPSSITFGQPLPLKVDILGPQIIYTASFSSPTGAYQVTGLSTGVLYNIVPAGLYGTVVITVTAENANPSTASLSIIKPSANIAPAFVNAILPKYPSVYAVNSNEPEEVEIFDV